MPPEKSAYALARYSRSPDSIRESMEWVRTHNSEKFLESFYFQYGHASIADLGHLVLCFEGISELAAIEIEDEPLWDGQAKSSRYQDFSRSGCITPPDLSPADAQLAGHDPTRIRFLPPVPALSDADIDAVCAIVEAARAPVEARGGAAAPAAGRSSTETGRRPGTHPARRRAP